VAPARVVVALRAPAERVGAFREWLDSFDLPLSVLWCNAPGVERLLAEHGLDAAAGAGGKGRDVWLALGVAASDHEYVVLHDADAKTYSAADVSRLLFPLDRGDAFSKGYYARVENGRLYGRLFRLFLSPLVRTLADEHDAPVLRYLASFRYALAGEFAMTADLAGRLRVEPRWGLEVGTLGDAFAAAGFEGTAQVDLGSYEHDHRSVSGPTGLTEMSEHVGEALFRVVEGNGVAPDYDSLARRYRKTATAMVEQYAADAAFNGLAYDPAAERTQVATYAESLGPPGEDRRLPAWADLSVEPADLLAASMDDEL